MTTVSYDKDFYAWTKENARLLRQNRLSEIDIHNIAEELEGISRSERRELVNRLALLTAHLLCWQFQPERQSNSWRNTIEIQRGHIADLIEDSPSLKSEIKNLIGKIYEKALHLAVAETGLNRNIFPESCPYSVEEII